MSEVLLANGDAAAAAAATAAVAIILLFRFFFFVPLSLIYSFIFSNRGRCRVRDRVTGMPHVNACWMLMVECSFSWFVFYSQFFFSSRLSFSRNSHTHTHTCAVTWTGGWQYMGTISSSATVGAVDTQKYTLNINNSNNNNAHGEMGSTAPSKREVERGRETKKIARNANAFNGTQKWHNKHPIFLVDVSAAAAAPVRLYRYSAHSIAFLSFYGEHFHRYAHVTEPH